jgi:hypothetical protein
VHWHRVWSARVDGVSDLSYPTLILLSSLNIYYFLVYFYIKNDKYLRMKGGPVFASGGRRIPEIIDQRE